MKQIFISISLSLFFFSCTKPELVPHAAPIYFQLPTYFQKEIQQLQKAQTTLEKFIQKDGKNENKILLEPNWEKEFSTFMEMDLNKPALHNEYHVDSVMVGNDLEKLIYKAKNSELEIQEVSILYGNGSIQHIKIKKNIKNQVFSSHQVLNYAKNGYIINGGLQVLKFYSTRYTIHGKFKK